MRPVNVQPIFSLTESDCARGRGATNQQTQGRRTHSLSPAKKYSPADAQNHCSGKQIEEIVYAAPTYTVNSSLHKRLLTDSSRALLCEGLQDRQGTDEYIQPDSENVYESLLIAPAVLGRRCWAAGVVDLPTCCFSCSHIHGHFGTVAAHNDVEHARFRNLNRIAMQVGTKPGPVTGGVGWGNVHASHQTKSYQTKSHWSHAAAPDCVSRALAESGWG